MRNRTAQNLLLFIAAVLWLHQHYPLKTANAQGTWNVLLDNAGIASMHTAVTHYGNVIFLDRTNIGPSQINLTNGVCRDNAIDLTLTHDCSAHSVLFTPGPNTVRPLFIFTDTWCSSGQFGPDGTLVQTGGDNDGLMKVRRFTPCPSDQSCDWVEESDNSLQDGRWYASNQLLPDGRQIVVGGRSVFTLEFIPASGSQKVVLPFLNQTDDAQNDNYYPFVHLLPDGNLYIFANRDSIVYNYQTNTVVKTFPTIPGEPRNYPSAGSSVMLPLQADAENVYGANVEVLVCGGAQPNCFLYPAPFPPASQTCGRISVTGTDAPAWNMEEMPFRRAMGDMVFVASGDVLIVNGAENGCQGWGNAINPTLSPVMYVPGASEGSRFITEAPSTIPRVYHSTANLLPDGRVLIAGSNTHQFYTFTGDFPTELRVEAFSPSYLDSSNDGERPSIVSAPTTIVYGQAFTVQVQVTSAAAEFGVSLVSSPFTTHSFSQGLRFLRLRLVGQVLISGGDSSTSSYSVNVTAPPNSNVAPPAYYMLFVDNQGIPSAAASWVQITNS
ncbi:hypothetical protein GOP47_0006827 [Adiantum capillus-veneris]|uniref:Galactose oxidase n=1 Tax=Adiantum capillus-veneris TaxID=13818 RepID=A0A9D4V3M7_ADICA|nr:hypothetical protein GOP47_0006827 [Adiantum capillus-veneris]